MEKESKRIVLEGVSPKLRSEVAVICAGKTWNKKTKPRRETSPTKVWWEEEKPLSLEEKMQEIASEVDPEVLVEKVKVWENGEYILYCLPEDKEYALQINFSETKGVWYTRKLYRGGVVDIHSYPNRGESVSFNTVD